MGAATEVAVSITCLVGTADLFGHPVLTLQFDLLNEPPKQPE
jgi:hypothetical protein